MEDMDYTEEIDYAKYVNSFAGEAKSLAVDKFGYICGVHRGLQIGLELHDSKLLGNLLNIIVMLSGKPELKKSDGKSALDGMKEARKMKRG